MNTKGSNESDMMDLLGDPTLIKHLMTLTDEQVCVCVCMRVCVCVCMRVCVRACVYVCMYEHAHVYIHGSYVAIPVVSQASCFHVGRKKDV